MDEIIGNVFLAGRVLILGYNLMHFIRTIAKDIGR